MGKKITGRLRLEIDADDQDARLEWFGILGTTVERFRRFDWDVSDVEVEVVEAREAE